MDETVSAGNFGPRNYHPVEQRAKDLFHVDHEQNEDEDEFARQFLSTADVLFLAAGPSRAGEDLGGIVPSRQIFGALSFAFGPWRLYVMEQSSNHHRTVNVGNRWGATGRR
jgi:hypothetical protein